MGRGFSLGRNVHFKDLVALLLEAKPDMHTGNVVAFASSWTRRPAPFGPHYQPGWVYDVRVEDPVDLSDYAEVDLDWSYATRKGTVMNGIISSVEDPHPVDLFEFVLRKDEDVPYQLFCKKTYRTERKTG